jgi:outer membrane protein OmpA-like peptidoglycan-associated protein
MQRTAVSFVLVGLVLAGGCAQRNAKEVVKYPMRILLSEEILKGPDARVSPELHSLLAPLSPKDPSGPVYFPEVEVVRIDLHEPASGELSFADADWVAKVQTFYNRTTPEGLNRRIDLALEHANLPRSILAAADAMPNAEALLRMIPETARARTVVVGRLPAGMEALAAKLQVVASTDEARARIGAWVLASADDSIEPVTVLFVPRGQPLAHADEIPASGAARVETILERIPESQIVFKATVCFSLNSTELTQRALAVLDEVVAKVRAHPGTSIHVRGFTDTSGTEQLNTELSWKRAASVVSHIDGQLGHDIRFIDPIGLGESNPVSANDSEVGRAANRRAEVYVIQRAQGGAASSDGTAQEPRRTADS